MPKTNSKKEFWTKEQRTKAQSYQRQVHNQLEGVKHQLAHIEEFDPTFHQVAQFSAQPFLSLAERLGELSFEGKKQRHQFITLAQFEAMLKELNSAIKVWNNTLRSPESKLSMNLASFRKSNQDLQVLLTWDEQEQHAY